MKYNGCTCQNKFSSAVKILHKLNFFYLFSKAILLSNILGSSKLKLHHIDVDFVLKVDAMVVNTVTECKCVFVLIMDVVINLKMITVI